MVGIEQRFCTYLLDNRGQFIQKWQKKLIISESDPFRDEIVLNGIHLLQLVIDFIMERKGLEDIKPLCDKIAIERSHADANIGDFVYNANAGRNELFEVMYGFDVKIADLKPIVKKIHMFFDQLIYCTVLKYSEMIARSLEKKQQFIDETHKERLTILGQMSASFVHEFRNPLTSIMGFIKLLRAEHPQLPYLDIVSHELDQLNFRISQFLLVSRKEMWNEAEDFALPELFQEIIHFLYPSLVHANVSMEQNVSLATLLRGYRNEIRQVLLNLMMNSIDALEDVPRDRQIKISAYEDTERIYVIVQNNGPMIDEHRTQTIFEPFVTTKKLGTGIGLFVCRQIVEKHHGSIICESDQEWTKFIISFQKQHT